MTNLATDKSLNNSQWVSIIGGLLFIAVSGSEIMWRFKTLETDYLKGKETIELRIDALEEKINAVNSRIDRRINPIEIQIKELQNRHE